MKYRLKYRTTHPVRNAVALALGVSILLGSLSAYGSNASDLANFPIASNDSADGRQSNRRVERIFTEDQARVAVDQP